MKFLCVIGDPVKHSKSPRIHNNAIKSLGLDGVYTRYHLQEESELRNLFFKLKLNGANITLPFKEQALKIARNRKCKHACFKKQSASCL